MKLKRRPCPFGCWDAINEARSLFLSTLPRCECGAIATKRHAGEKSFPDGPSVCDECQPSDDWTYRIDGHAAVLAKWEAE